MPPRAPEPAPRAARLDGDGVRWLTGWRALLTIWPLTTVPAGFSVYIIRTALSERWPVALHAAETPLGTLVLWLALTFCFTAWGLSSVRRHEHQDRLLEPSDRSRAARRRDEGRVTR